jgi:hypothetical protein
VKMMPKHKAYFVCNFGDVVEPDNVKNKEDAEETVEDVVDRKHLDKLDMENIVLTKISDILDLSSLYSGGVDDPCGEDTNTGVGPG